MGAFHQRAAAAVPLEEAIEFVLLQAAKPDGVSVAQVAAFCEVQETAAKNRLQAALDVHTLIRAQRPTDIGGRAMDVRWFVHQHDADAFTTGRPGSSPTKAAARTPVQVVEVFKHRTAFRDGCDDHRQFGSRQGDRIVYGDGTVRHITETMP
jgi:hypothetical protein